MNSDRSHPHFLIVCYPVQSHIGPSLHLAHRLLSLSPSALVSFSTSATASSHLSSTGNLTVSPYPDGYESSSSSSPDATSSSSSTTTTFFLDLNSRGGPHFTCVIYTLLLTWAADVAASLDIPAIQFWIQPATVFATYYHFFQQGENFTPTYPLYLPKLPPMQQPRDLPSFLVDSPPNLDAKLQHYIRSKFRELFERLDNETKKSKAKPKILANTFAALEEEALSSVDCVEILPVGPVLPPSADDSQNNFSLFCSDEDKKCMEWLGTKAERSVVYVSFGSISVMKRRQMEEMLKGLKASGRPYLWVVRKDNKNEVQGFEFDDDDDNNGLVVEWCSQRRVLSHVAVGCFVTHCGWNSTVESLVSGVPVVGVAQWSDQTTNAMMVERVWGVGVRGEVDGEAVLGAEELGRCLEVVMGEGEQGREMRRRAGEWKEKAREAVEEGGEVDRNLKGFLELAL